MNNKEDKTIPTTVDAERWLTPDKFIWQDKVWRVITKNNNIVIKQDS